MSIYDLIGVLGGLGIFLLGMKMMGQGLELAAGSKLRAMLEKITSNKFVATLVGLAVTAVIQSSSATDAMVVGFANAGLMEFSQTVGILFGSKIGTTVTSLLLAIDMKKIVPIFTFLGVLVMIFIKKNNYRYYGQIVAGFGILFQGMTIMSQSLEGLKNSSIFQDAVTSLASPFLGIIIGTVFTAIIQSSSASVGILMAIGSAGLITLPQCIYVVYGMNIGACMAAVLSAMGTNRTAKQVALCNFLISLIGAGILTGLTIFLPIADMIEMIFPNMVAAQISAAHIFFNIAITVILLPCSSLLVKLTRLILPDAEDSEKEKMGTVYLDPLILNTPPMAVSQTEKECARLASMARKNLNYALKAVFEKDKKYIAKVSENEKAVDYLTHCITDYIVKINGLDIMDYDRKVMGAMYNAIQDLERISDRAENICECAQQIIGGVVLTDEAMRELAELCKVVQDIIENSFYMFSHQSKDPNLIEAVLKAEDQIDEYTELFKLNHIRRLSKGTCTPEAGTVFLELLTNLERVGDHAINVAFCIPYKNRNMTQEQNIVTTTI